MGTSPSIGTLWKSLVALFICFAFNYSPVNSDIRDYVATPNYPEDSEPRRQVTMPDNPIAYFKSYTKGSEYVGLLQAGRAEFPWVVAIEHLRPMDDEIPDESWAVGNLVNYQYVLTTCKAIYHLSGDKTLAEVPKPQMKITFCTNYLLEDYKRYGQEEDVLYSVRRGRVSGGVRKSKEVMTHVNCKVRTSLAWDIALILINNGIPPIYYPVIGYMPLYNQGDYSKKLAPIDLSRQEAQKLVCHIASFGKSYVNSPRHYVVNYKVRYRVYWTKMQDCEHFLKWICEDSTKDPACSKGIGTVAKGQLMCFMSRAVQGAVCDHDRGAPLVCNGEVYGLVTRAAKFTLCNNRLPLYFLVNKFDAFQDFFDKHSAQITKGYPRD